MTEQAQNPIGDFEVASALPHEQLALRMLLGNAANPMLRPRLFVAHARIPVIAAAALQAGPITPHPGYRVALGVPDIRDNLPLAEALVARISQDIFGSGRSALYALNSVDADGAEADTRRALGFASEVSVQTYEADPQVMLALLEPIHQTLEERGRIPVDARVVPLWQAPHAPIADMHVRHLGGSRPVIRARLRGIAPESYLQSLSWVLMLGDRVAGSLLARMVEPDVPMINAAVVAPELRMGWSNLLLKLDASKKAVKNRRRALRPQDVTARRLLLRLYRHHLQRPDLAALQSLEIRTLQERQQGNQNEATDAAVDPVSS